MARSFIPFLDSNAMQWRGGDAYQELSSEFDPGDVEDETYYDSFAVKVLSFDAETGAQTKREYYKSGFVQHNYGYHRCAEEVYTLSGRFRYPDSAELFTAGCYVYRPPGWIHNGEVYEDTEVIVHHDALFSMITGYPEEKLRTNVLFEDPEEAIGPRGFVVHRNANFEAWVPGNVVLGTEAWETRPEGELSTRILSRNVTTGALTAIIKMEPGFRISEPGFSTTDEEAYVLEGELTIGENHFNPGCFYSRPSGYVRGPIESAHGCLLFASFAGTVRYMGANTVDIGSQINN